MRKLQISLPFQILQHKKSLHFIYPMPEKGTSFVGGGGTPRMGHHRELTPEHSFLVEQI